MADTVSNAARHEALERAKAHAPFLREAVAAFPDVASCFEASGALLAIAAALQIEGEAVEQRLRRQRRALALALALGMRPLQAHCHLGLGTLYRKTGRIEEARAELSVAVDLYRAMEMTFWLPEAEAELAGASTPLPSL